MSVSAPRVSIGLPVHDGDEFLADALDSLLRQTYEDFELVISDNGSSDDTEEICRDFAARDIRIRYLRYAENRGAYWNFNNAFRESLGEYFRWAAHDDMCEPELLEHCARALDEDPTVVWTQGTQVRKWKKVTLSALTKKGVVGGYLEQVSQRDKEAQAAS